MTGQPALPPLPPPRLIPELWVLGRQEPHQSLRGSEGVLEQSLGPGPPRRGAPIPGTSRPTLLITLTTLVKDTSLREAMVSWLRAVLRGAAWES